jgi:hypothetical protein
MSAPQSSLRKSIIGHEHHPIRAWPVVLQACASFAISSAKSLVASFTRDRYARQPQRGIILLVASRLPRPTA